jgi:hypothetical protein
MRLRQTQKVEHYDFEFEGEMTAPKKYGPEPVTGTPTRGTVKVIYSSGHEPLVQAWVQGPLLTAKGTPYKDGVEYWLDAPELGKLMLAMLGLDLKFEVKDDWVENGGLPNG